MENMTIDVAGLASVSLAIGAVVVLFLLGHGVALWYWKVNALLQSLERIETQLRDVTRILSKAHGIERSEDLAARMNSALGA